MGSSREYSEDICHGVSMPSTNAPENSVEHHKLLDFWMQVIPWFPRATGIIWLQMEDKDNYFQFP